MKFITKPALLLIGLILVLFACSKEVERKETEKTLIDTYLRSNPTTIDTLGIYYKLTTTGTEPLLISDSVKIIYKGTVLNSNTVFVVSDSLYFIYGSNQLILGWEKYLTFAKYTDSGILIIPFQLAYGSKPMGSIPPYATLLFEFSITKP